MTLHREGAERCLAPTVKAWLKRPGTRSHVRSQCRYHQQYTHDVHQTMARTRTRPTTPLFRIIETQALRESLSKEQLYARIGISASYYNQLSTDALLLSQASRTVIESISTYLDVPHVQVMMWAGQLDWNDFGQPRNPGATVNQYIDAVALQIEDDPHFREFAVPLREWSATPQPIKLRFVALYEHARQLRLQRELAASTPGLTLARAARLTDRLPGPQPAPPTGTATEPRPLRRRNAA